MTSSEFLDRALEWFDFDYKDGDFEASIEDTRAFIAIMKANEDKYNYDFVYEVDEDEEEDLFNGYLVNGGFKGRIIDRDTHAEIHFEWIYSSAEDLM